MTFDVNIWRALDTSNLPITGVRESVFKFFLVSKNASTFFENACQ